MRATLARRLAALPLLVGLGACAHAGGRDALARERLSRADAVDATHAAPELFSRYREASVLASTQGLGASARSDYETEAGLWLEAAVAEAERVQLSQERLELEREITTLEAAALEHERARAALAEQAEHRAARELARAEEELVLSRAALAPQKRVKLATPEVEEAAAALSARASLVVLALAAYGVPEARYAGITAKLGKARAALKKAPDEALKQADEALFLALALLSEVRVSTGQSVDELAKAALAEAITHAGARLARNDRGLSAILEHAYAGAALTSRAEQVLGRLCRVALGADEGPVQLDVMAKTQASAEARAKLLRTQLAKSGCAGARFRVEASVSPAEELEVTWLAY